MSASPQHTSTKRPLEEASSPSRNDQPDAKRPALDKVLRSDEEVKPDSESATAGEATQGEADATSAAATNGGSKENGEQPEAKENNDAQADTIVPDAPETDKPVSNAAAPMPSHIQNSQATNTHDETAWIHIRAVISSPEAATIIGKGGENVSKIRQMSGAKCTVSDYQKGAVERILTVSGIVDAVAKVGLYLHLRLYEDLD
jgi:poly(rC)-binding protein 2/3/4